MGRDLSADLVKWWGTALNVNVLRLQQLLVKPADSKDFAADIELYGSLCSLLDVLERLYKFSAQLQMRLVSEPVPLPALCQALCILMSSALSAQSFFQLMSRSALLSKCVDCVKMLAGVPAWRHALLDSHQCSDTVQLSLMECMDRLTQAAVAFSGSHQETHGAMLEALGAGDPLVLLYASNMVANNIQAAHEDMHELFTGAPPAPPPAPTTAQPTASPPPSSQLLLGGPARQPATMAAPRSLPQPPPTTPPSVVAPRRPRPDSVTAFIVAERAAVLGTGHASGLQGGSVPGPHGTTQEAWSPPSYPDASYGITGGPTHTTPSHITSHITPTQRPSSAFSPHGGAPVSIDTTPPTPLATSPTASATPLLLGPPTPSRAPEPMLHMALAPRAPPPQLMQAGPQPAVAWEQQPRKPPPDAMPMPAVHTPVPPHPPNMSHAMAGRAQPPTSPQHTPSPPITPPPAPAPLSRSLAGALAAQLTPPQPPPPPPQPPPQPPSVRPPLPGTPPAPLPLSPVKPEPPSVRSSFQGFQPQLPQTAPHHQSTPHPDPRHATQPQTPPPHHQHPQPHKTPQQAPTPPRPQTSQPRPPQPPQAPKPPQPQPPGVSPSPPAQASRGLPGGGRGGGQSGRGGRGGRGPIPRGDEKEAEGREGVEEEVAQQPLPAQVPRAGPGGRRGGRGKGRGGRGGQGPHSGPESGDEGGEGEGERGPGDTSGALLGEATTGAPAPTQPPPHTPAPAGALVPAGAPVQEAARKVSNKRSALLVGCNYPGTQAALNGCVNDARSMKAMLQSHFGFQPADITLMLDTDPTTTKPTGKAIRAKLKDMVAQAQGNDILVFHFSGHGTQVPSADGDEADGKDEALCPCDMYVITDDDLKVILEPLRSKPGVKFTMIADCCHSGTMLDGENITIGGAKAGKEGDAVKGAAAMQGVLAGMGARGMGGEQEGAERGGQEQVVSRSLPSGTLCSVMSQQLGIPVALNAFNKIQEERLGAHEGKGRKRGFLSGLGKVLGFGQEPDRPQPSDNKPDQTQPDDSPSVGGVLGSAIAAGASFLGNLFEGKDDDPPTPTPDEPPPKPPPKPPSKPPSPKPPPTPQPTQTPASPAEGDLGILITGCQEQETSADVIPNNDLSRACGAMSSALQQVVEDHKRANPGTPITNRALVKGVRSHLAKKGYTQNPCLECSPSKADWSFLV